MLGKQCPVPNIFFVFLRQTCIHSKRASPWYAEVVRVVVHRVHEEESRMSGDARSHRNAPGITGAPTPARALVCVSRTRHTRIIKCTHAGARRCVRAADPRILHLSFPTPFLRREARGAGERVHAASAAVAEPIDAAAASSTMRRTKKTHKKQRETERKREKAHTKESFKIKTVRQKNNQISTYNINEEITLRYFERKTGSNFFVCLFCFFHYAGTSRQLMIISITVIRLCSVCYCIFKFYCIIQNEVIAHYVLSYCHYVVLYSTVKVEK